MAQGNDRPRARTGSGDGSLADGPRIDGTSRAGGQLGPQVEAAVEASVGETLKERAMDEAPIGITISDPSLPDNPLVYVNDAFERITGYTREEAIGRNCRFLQGEGTDESSVEALREAVETETATTVDIRNYRKDGERFWNRVAVAPLFDESGDPSHFVGFQMDVTRRKLAERAARERARALRDERQAFADVLDRVDGLLADVTETLVQSVDRRDLFDRTCQRVASTPGYALVWIGEYDRAADEVDPVVCYHGSGESVAAEELGLSFADTDPVSQAIEAEEVQVVDDATKQPGGQLHGPEWPDRYGSMVATPLTYDDVTYGVLCAYAREPGGFGEHERVVLTSLGRMLATATNAVETHRRIAADERAEARFDVSSADLFPVQLADRCDCRVGFAGVERSASGSLTALFDVSGATPAEVRTVADDIDGIEAASVVVEGGDGCLVGVTGSDTHLVTQLAERGVTVDAFDAAPGGGTLELSIPEPTDDRSIVDVVESTCEGATLQAYRRNVTSPTTQREFLATVEKDLTRRQRAALVRAHAAGFFETPRETTGEELAASMDLSTSTFHEHLRAALRKLVTDVLDHPQESFGGT